MTDVYPLDTAARLEEIHRLWLHSLGPNWAVEPSSLRTYLEGNGSDGRSISLGIYAGAQLIGFLAAQYRSGSAEAGLVVLMVGPAHQRRGLGTRLCHEAVMALRAQGVTSLRLGAGGTKYFWPGVPQACRGALGFFQARGWIVEEQCHDLVQDISGYARQVPLPQNVEISFLRAQDADALVTFVARHFPSWASAYAQTVQAGHLTNVVTAWCDGTMVGVTLIDSAAQRGGHPWQPVLGADMGLLSAVGVAERYRGRGIGLCLVDFGSYHLCMRGVRTCLVGWTWLVEWYGRLGYRIWQTYDMCLRKI